MKVSQLVVGNEYLVVHKGEVYTMVYPPLRRSGWITMANGTKVVRVRASQLAPAPLGPTGDSDRGIDKIPSPC